jgi:hypothetical protein
LKERRAGPPDGWVRELESSSFVFTAHRDRGVPIPRCHVTDGCLLVLWLNCQSVVCICGDLCCAFAFSEDGEGQSLSLSEIWPRGIPVISLCRPMQPSDLSKRSSAPRNRMRLRFLRVLSALLACNFGPTLAVLCRKTRHQTMSVCILARFVWLV